MSSSPVHRFASAGSNSKREEDLINAYEAEEERIINVLSRKLEQLREEKIDLENALEAESESHVNRLSRELSALRLAQHLQQQQQTNGLGSGMADGVDAKAGMQALLNGSDPRNPSAEVMLEAMRRENEQLRNRLVDTEQAYIRFARLNDIYREELIEHRRKLGISVDNLIGLSSNDPYSQPTHRRTSSVSRSPTLSTSTLAFPSRPSVTNSVPIPRPPSQIHRPNVQTHAHPHTQSGMDPSTVASSLDSPDSPFPLSPVALHTNPASYVSAATHVTTPPSSASLTSNPPAPYPLPPPSLSYPSVPPPSLSSSFGSPTIPFHMPHRRDSNGSPIDTLSRRESFSRRRGSFERRISESGGLSSLNSSRSRGNSYERGGRVAETGSLIRSRSDSVAMSDGPTTKDPLEGESLPIG